MIILGIESTAHTYGVSVLDDEEILSNVKSVYTTKSGGIIPRLAAEHHVRNSGRVLKKGLSEAGIKPDDINLVCFSQSPGIGSCLEIGALSARIMSLKLGVPIIGVNHCVAHLEIAKKITGFNDPVMLYVSGANTQVISYSGGRYRIFGETLDIGVGNLLDSFGRHTDMGFPSGQKIERLAKKSSDYIKLPYSVKGMDVNFGGLLTNIKRKYSSGKYELNDLCHSLQETVFSMLVEISERALAHCEKEQLVLTGGVAANKRLQKMCRKMCSDRGGFFKPIPKSLAGDNAAMIAWTGLLRYNNAGRGDKLENTCISQRIRTDMVTIPWMN